MKNKTRRDFLQKTALASGGIVLGTHALSAKSYRRILGSNDRVQVGISGFSQSGKGCLDTRLQRA